MPGTEEDPQLSREDALPDDAPVQGRRLQQQRPRWHRRVEEEPSEPGKERAGPALTSPVLPNLTARKSRRQLADQ